MSLLRNIASGLRSLFQKERADRELDEELQGFMEMAAEESMKQGRSEKDARRAVRLERGSVEAAKEHVRSAGWESLLETSWQDLCYGLRMLRKSPGFTAVAILTLALGIGANTTIFSAISAILLRKPPVKDPDTLCAVASADQASADDLVWVSAPDFLSWQIQNHVFEAMAADESGRSFTLTGKNGPQEVDGERVTTDYFRIIGFTPFLGRTFLPLESQAGNDHVVILSYSLWRERYNADPNIIGKHLDVDTVPYTVVGVMPQGAALPLPQLPPRLWTPLVFGSDDLTPGARSNHYLNIVIARLKPGVTVRQAQADMDLVAERLAAEYPSTDAHWGVTVLTLQEYRIRWAQIRPFMMILFTVVGFVLLIACANIAGLLLSRGAVRAHEMAVRAAIGAGRARLARQLLTESLLIGFAGGAGGLILSVWGIRFLRAGFFNLYGGQGAPSLHLDQRTLLFTLIIALLSVIVFGLVPAFQSSNVDPGHALSESGRTGSSSFARSHLRSVLVTGEIALSVVLLAGAGVALDQLVQHFSAPLGFNPHHLVVASLHLDSPRYRDAAARTAFFEQVTKRLRSISGVKSSALDNCLPFDCGYGTSFAVIGRPPSPKSQTPSAEYAMVGPGYFATMQIPLVKGREFADSDNSQSPAVAIVSQELAWRYFVKGDAIGKWIEATTLDAKPAQIIGIAANVSNWGATKPDPQIYECDLQFPFTAFPGTSLVVRSKMAVSALVPMLSRAMWSVDGDQPVDGIETMDDLFSRSGNADKVISTLFGIFAAVALVLAAVGTYGVIAYSVSQRTREIGIRLALGAQRKDVFGLVLEHGALLAAIGCVIGFLLALPLLRILSTSLNDPPATWPLVSLAVALIVAIISLLACYIPARRAMRVDPMVALRYE